MERSKRKNRYLDQDQGNRSKQLERIKGKTRDQDPRIKMQGRSKRKTRDLDRHQEEKGVDQDR